MTVLYTIGFLAVVILLLLIVTYINEYSTKHYSYEFFSFGNLAVVAIAYLMLFYGDKWYSEELVKGGDILNGQILMGIGVLVISALVYVHIKNTSILFAAVVTPFQLILYIPAAVLSIFAFIIVAAWLSETKPVYRL
jgi:hypothetical protein